VFVYRGHRAASWCLAFVPAFAAAGSIIVCTRVCVCVCVCVFVSAFGRVDSNTRARIKRLVCVYVCVCERQLSL